MSVQPDARGRGVARGLDTTMATVLYRRAGFIEHCALPVYASAAIWSGAH